MRSIFGQFIFEHFPSYIICFLFRQHFWVLKNRNLLFCSDGDFLMLHWTHFFAKKAFDRSAWTSRTYFPKKKILWGRHSPVDSSAFREDSEWTQSTNSVECSVTKFGEIYHFGKIIQVFLQIFVGWFDIWQSVEATSANLLHYWVNFHCCKWPNIETQSNHLVTLIEWYFLS